MKNKLCYIVGAGSFEPEKFHPSAGSYIIAADGGYAPLKKAGITPDIVVGDFDSLGYVPDKINFVKHPAVKDDTDMMLAVKLGLEAGFTGFAIYGGLGGRLDHTLANIQTLGYIADRGARGCLVGENTIITVIRNGKISFDASHKGTVSVFCLGGKAFNVNITGMKYPLSGAALTSSLPIGVSNEFTGSESIISVESGSLIVMWNGGSDIDILKALV